MFSVSTSINTKTTQNSRQSAIRQERAKKECKQQLQADSSYVEVYGTCPGCSERVLSHDLIMVGTQSKVIGQIRNEASVHVDA